MAAGNALLALAGPVGWAIGGSIGRSALFARSRNEKIAKEADEKEKEIEVLNRQFKSSLFRSGKTCGRNTEAYYIGCNTN